MSTNAVICLAISNDFARVAYDRMNEAAIWEVQGQYGGKEPLGLGGFRASISCVAISRDGRRVVAGGNLTSGQGRM